MTRSFKQWYFARSAMDCDDLVEQVLGFYVTLKAASAAAARSMLPAARWGPDATVETVRAEFERGCV